MSGDWISITGRALVPAAVFTAFALARKYLPARRLKTTDFAALDERFANLNLVVGLVMILVAVAFAWSSHALLAGLNRHLALADDPNGLHLLPQTAIWWFFPGFAAVTLSWEITLQLWSLFAGRNIVSRYAAWSNQRSGFDSRRVLGWMGVVIVLPIGLFTLLAVPMHATLSNSEIHDCGYAFARCQIYRYSDARRMTEVEGFRDRDGKLTHRAGIVVDFSDGRRWSSADWGNFKAWVDPNLLQLLKERTGLPHNRAQTEADIR